MLTMDKAHIDWSRHHFEMMAEGGVWGIPRSGLLFGKRGDTLVLLSRMPWVEGMPLSARALRQQQDRDVAGVKEHFEAAGIKVVDNDAS